MMHFSPSLARNVPDDGRVFFDTTEPLVPSAAVGASHVYEYQNGQLHLTSGRAIGQRCVFL